MDDWNRLRKLHGRNLTKHQKQMLRELRGYIKMERAEFSCLSEGDTLPKTEQDVTLFIKHRTKLYFDSWALPIVDALLGKPEGAHSDKGAHSDEC